MYLTRLTLSLAVTAAVLHGGEIAISDFANNTVSLFTPAGSPIGNPIDVSANVSGASGVTIGGDGDIYVTGQNTNNVARYTPSGTFLNNFVAPGSGGLSSAQDVKFGPDGNLYVVSSANDQILKYNGATGAFISVFATLNKPSHNGPIDLLFAPDGFLYVTAFDGSKILRLNEQNGAVVDTFSPPAGADTAFVGVAVTGNDVYASVINPNDGTGSVLLYNETTRALVKTIVSSGQDGLGGPADLGLLNGQLLVEDDFNGQVLQFNAATGSFTGTLLQSSSLAAPLFLDVSSIPEPGTWTLLALGLMLIFARRLWSAVHERVDLL
ncbi:MAG TPA: PEP-CTERM sorting domain-containing protein [Bryobacteraceae bacterium]|nr:PEP-CTERM sorting domain-containing protein [Bryobacteraceae bacterium]